MPVDSRHQRNPPGWWRAALRTSHDLVLTLLARPWLTLATALGVILGVASASFTLMLTASERAQVERRFDRQLANLVVIEADPGPVTVSPLERDQMMLLDAAPGGIAGGELSTWRREMRVQPSRYGPAVVVPLFGVSNGGLRAAGVQLAVGRATPDGAQAAPVLWVGEDLASSLGIAGDAGAPQTVFVDGQRLTVAGVTSGGSRYPALGRALIVSSWFAHERWGDPEQARTIELVKRGSAPVAAAYLLSALDPTRSNQLRDATAPDGVLTRARVGGDLQRAGALLSALALIFGALSVANVLSSAVVQRRSELGLRAALGWTAARIARLILGEAVVLALYAAVLGTALGLAAALIVCAGQGWEPSLPGAALWVPALVGVLAGAAGGVAPALRAGRIPPTEALRS